MPVSLPDNPSLDRLRREARDLQRAVHAGDPDALTEVSRRHPAGPPSDHRSFTLTAAQLVIARRCGFASWPRLRHYLDAAGPLRRTMPVATGDGGDAGIRPPADEFGALACLVYSPVDGPDRWSRALEILDSHPDIAAASPWAAAAAGDARALRDHLSGGDSASRVARAEGGPYRWTPLMYLTYSRIGVADPARGAAVPCATLLLDAGADPNDGYLWRGMPTPFTVLTGVFGGGEQGPDRQPPHPAGPALARLLLDRGADPNDAQALYNRMFTPDDDHLELLLQHGLGGGDGGPWRRRLDGVLDPPADLLRQQLAWAIHRGFDGRVALLIRHGVDVRSPLPAWPCPTLAGLSPADAAARVGDHRIAATLRAALDREPGTPVHP